VLFLRAAEYNGVSKKGAIKLHLEFVKNKK
jgi:hypothetical protein